MLVEPRWIWKNNSDSNKWGILTHKWSEAVGDWATMAQEIWKSFGIILAASMEHRQCVKPSTNLFKWTFHHKNGAFNGFKPAELRPPGPVVLTQKSCQFFNVAALALQKKGLFEQMMGCMCSSAAQEKAKWHPYYTLNQCNMQWIVLQFLLVCQKMHSQLHILIAHISLESSHLWTPCSMVSLSV